MPDIATIERARHGSSSGQPLTRRDRFPQGDRRRALCRRQPSRTPAARVARRRVGGARKGDASRCRRRQGASRRRRGDDARTTCPSSRRRPTRRTIRSPSRSTCSRNADVRYAHTADRCRHRRDARGGAGGRGAARCRATTNSRPASAWTLARPSSRRLSAPASRPKGAQATLGARLAEAAQTIEATYETAPQYHNAMEPHAIVAQWDGDKLILDTPSQALSMAQGRLAGLFGMQPQDILIRSPFLGGGFGSKAIMTGAAGARHPRRQADRAPGEAGPAARADVRSRRPSRRDAADAAARHGCRWHAGGDRPPHAHDHPRPTTISTSRLGTVARHLYASKSIASSHDAVRADVGTPVFMRAPGEATAQRRAGERDGRDGGKARHRSARVPLEELTPKSSRSPTSHFPRRRCGNVISRARKSSAGRGGPMKAAPDAR